MILPKIVIKYTIVCGILKNTYSGVYFHSTLFFFLIPKWSMLFIFCPLIYCPSASNMQELLIQTPEPEAASESPNQMAKDQLVEEAPVACSCAVAGSWLSAESGLTLGTLMGCGCSKGVPALRQDARTSCIHVDTQNQHI